MPVLVSAALWETAGQGGASLRLDHVTYTYRGRNEPALADLQLDVPAGATVALVGPSGAGKTTVAHLLMRFWDPDSGTMVMAGHDLRDYRLDDLRRRTALVAQDTYLFNDTLRGNILIAEPDADEAALMAAVRRASLDDVVAGLPEGLDTMVGERGMRLSGGQRQRVAIARAFLKKATIILPAEPPAARHARWRAPVEEAADVLRRSNLLQLRLVDGGIEAVPLLEVAIAPACGLDAMGTAIALQDGLPSVHVDPAPAKRGAININPLALKPGEGRLAAERLLAVLDAAAGSR